MLIFYGEKLSIILLILTHTRIRKCGNILQQLTTATHVESVVLMSRVEK